MRSKTDVVSLQEAKMFWIYENWQAGPHKAVIHRGECGHCNQGNGVRGGYDPSHGQWHGPFETIEIAQNFSEGLPNVWIRRNCGHCLRH